jgi:virginiamycin B lyase
VRPTTVPSPTAVGTVSIRELPVPRGSAPHDVAPAADGGIWYTAQATGELGWLDPRTGQTKHVKLGTGSRPHGVILGPDGAPWITDSGLNAIVRVDPRTSEVTRYGLPGRNHNLNTAVFDRDGILWFTGQGGIFGNVNKNGSVRIFDAPRGPGPYGITATPSGDVYYASLAGDHVAKIVNRPGAEVPGDIVAQVIEPPTKDNGARRVWSDSKGVIWVSEWDAGQLGRYDPASGQWKEWKLPGARPQAYAVFVDDRDMVWLSDFGASALVRFDPATEKFESFPHAAGGNVRQIHGRPGEVFAPLSALDRIVVVTTR